MLKDFATLLVILLSVLGSTRTIAGPPDREVEIDRCAAMAAMLASAYETYPDDVALRTELIRRNKVPIQDELGATDRHLMSAYAAMAFYDGKRVARVVPKTQPVDTSRIAAEGAARCMAAAYDRGAP